MIKIYPGVDVMSTFFCDFRQFSVKKLEFFSKTNVMIKFLKKLAVVRGKNANIFADFLSKIFLQIITSVPDCSLRPVLNFVQWLFFHHSHWRRENVDITY
jgi:hypothetical protein